MKTKKIHKYQVVINWSEKDQCYVADVPELKGCATHGATVTEAADMAKEAIEIYLESLKARGIEIPVPMAERVYSGKLVLRIDPKLHRDLALKAECEKVSLNRLIEKKLVS